MKTKNSKAKPKRLPGVGSNRIVTPQPDRDFAALKACCKAMDSIKSPRMVQATLEFLNSKYAPPGAV